jgi:hypothetical protein
MPTPTLTLFGSQLQLLYQDTLTAPDRQFGLDRLTLTTELLNLHAAQLSPGALKAIGQISIFTLADSHTYLGETGPHTMTLSVQYVHSCTAAWLGSLFAHEGQHALNHGLYKGTEAWRDEQVAGTVQLDSGKVLGFGSFEIQYLEHWIAAANQAAMQQHMQRGLRC